MSMALRFEGQFGLVTAAWLAATMSLPAEPLTCVGEAILTSGSHGELGAHCICSQHCIGQHCTSGRHGDRVVVHGYSPTFCPGCRCTNLAAAAAAGALISSRNAADNDTAAARKSGMAMVAVVRTTWGGRRLDCQRSRPRPAVKSGAARARG